MKSKELKRLVTAKLEQWGREAMIAAGRAIMQGKTATLITYPSGLKKMRFAEPFTDFGMHYEVSPDAWSALIATGGKVIS